MRFIHTADWHLGNSMYRIDRSSEADAFLAWLKERIVAEKADALIVSGDIFDTFNPVTAAREKYFSFLASLKETQCKTVIITGGNHDSGMLLDAPGAVLEDLGGLSVYVVGSMSGREIDDVVFEMHDAAGEVCGICAALPYMREMDLRRLASEAGGSVKSADSVALAESGGSVENTGGPASCAASEVEPEELYREVFARAFAAAERLRNGRNIPVIATGHLYAADLDGRFAVSSDTDGGNGACCVSESASAAPNNADNQDTGDVGSEFEANTSDDGVRQLDIVGKLGRIHSSVFPAGFDYVALGHIHYTTMVAKNPKIRYSGSPFVLGFDESFIPHHVLCVDAGREKQPDVTKLEVPQTLHFMRVSGTVAELTGKLMELAANPRWPAESFFVEVCHASEIGLNIHEALESVLKDAPFIVANWKIQRTPSLTAGELYDAGLDGAGQLTEKDIFSMLVKAKLSVDENSDEYKLCMEELLPLFMEVAHSISVGGDGAEAANNGALDAGNVARNAKDGAQAADKGAAFKNDGAKGGNL